jgi:hypothetical protein
MNCEKCINCHKGGKLSRKVKGILKTSAGSYGALASGLLLAGNALKGDLSGSIIQAAILAPSIYGMVKGIKNIKSAKSKKHKGSGKKPHPTFTDKVIHNSKIIGMMQKHPDNRKYHVSHLKIPNAKLRKIIKLVKYEKMSGSGYNLMYGSGLKSSISKLAKKAHKNVSDFFEGKKSYKPSDLLRHISNATGVASVFVPEMFIPTLAAKLGSTYLQSKGKGHPVSFGRGLKLAGGRGLKLAGGAYRTSGYGLRLAGDYSQKGGMVRVGSKKDVWNGKAKQTSGGLKKDSLMKNKRGKIVSKKQHANGVRMYKLNKDKLKSY